MKTKVQNTKFKTPNTSRGITLIALVITIIILLILAGVAINMVIDSDGLFGKANEAVTKWNAAVAEEEKIVQNVLEQMNEINGGNTGDGNELPEGWDSAKVADVVTEGTRTAPIPVGYVASQIPTEDTISEGLVIYQGTNPVTGEKDSTAHTEAMNNRNQFVWIPVDNINYMVMCKSNASGSVCNLSLQTDGTLKCETHNSTELCGRLYNNEITTTDTTTPYKYTTNMNFEDRSQVYNANTGLREPAIVTGNNAGTGTSYDGEDSNLTNIGLLEVDNKTIQQVFLEQLTSDFTAMATSVAKYGGFYVGRYEAGENGASLKNQKALVAGTNAVTGSDANTFVNGNKWYGMYNSLRNSTQIDKTAVSSHMIWRKSI